MDKNIPQLENIMNQKKDYKNDRQYQKLVTEISKMENQLKEKMEQSIVTIDDEINADYNTLLGMTDDKKVLLHPDHLNYLARQCKQMLIIRKNLGKSDNRSTTQG